MSEPTSASQKTDSAAEINEQQAIDRFLAIAAVSGVSRQERNVADAIATCFREAGIQESAICFDGAETRTRGGGDCGNMIITLPGNGSGPRTLLSAHMDTVPICAGSQPVVDGGRIRSKIASGVGADDRSGCCAILTAALERIAAGDDKFPPAVIAFFVQEEIGLQGARNLDVSKIGNVDRAFNFDGGTVEKLTVGATGGERIDIRINGLPAHAGVAPEQGVSAIIIASKAIADLDSRGWLGKIENEFGTGTANVGVIQGGDATNVITPEVTLRAEARSHDAEMRTRIVGEIRAAFEKASRELTNVEGASGSCVFESHVDYESFRLPEQHPSLATASEAVRRIGREPFQELANGGLDANWLFRHGLEAVTMGCGQRNIHSAEEYLQVADYLDACRIAKWLITDGAGGDG